VKKKTVKPIVTAKATSTEFANPFAAGARQTKKSMVLQKPNSSTQHLSQPSVTGA
jgi:hypothetical protein